MPTTPQATISTFLSERIAAGDFPSAVYVVSEKGRITFADALGHSVVEPYRITTSLDTIYDLASLTKPLVTGLLCAKRVEEGELTLDSAVAHYLPEFERTDRQMITVRQLLTHTSGLPAWRPLYILTEGDRDRAVSVIVNEPLNHPPDTRVVYSDLGFIVLGFLLERLTGHRLSQLAQTEIIEPLQLKRTFFNPDVALQTGIAACETGNAYERETCRTTGSGRVLKLARECYLGRGTRRQCIFSGWRVRTCRAVFYSFGDAAHCQPMRSGTGPTSEAANLQ